MTGHQLIAKKQFYSAKKVELESLSYEEDVRIKVSLFREEKEREILEYEQSVRKEFESQKDADLIKVNHYLELLDSLISESELTPDIPDVEYSQEEQQNDEIVKPLI